MSLHFFLSPYRICYPNLIKHDIPSPCDFSLFFLFRFIYIYHWFRGSLGTKLLRIMLKHMHDLLAWLIPDGIFHFRINGILMRTNIGLTKEIEVEGGRVSSKQDWKYWQHIMQSSSNLIILWNNRGDIFMQKWKILDTNRLQNAVAFNINLISVSNFII